MKERDRKRRDRANSKIGLEATLKAAKNPSRSSPYRATKKDTGCPEEFLRVRTAAQAQQLEKFKKQASLERGKLRQLCLDSSAVEGSASTSIQHMEQAASRQSKGEYDGRLSTCECKHFI